MKSRRRLPNARDWYFCRTRIPPCNDVTDTDLWARNGNTVHTVVFWRRRGRKGKRNEEAEEKTEDRHDLLRLGKTNIAATKIAEQA